MSSRDPAKDGIRYAVDAVALLYGTYFVMMYIRYYYQDLYTQERKSVAHRRNPPERTKAYKAVALATLVFAICGQIYLIAVPIVHLTYGRDEYKGICNVGAGLNTINAVSILAVYYIYELRLYLVYKGTKYDRNGSYRTLFVGFLTLYGGTIFIWAFGATSFGLFGDWQDDGTDDCLGTAPVSYILLVLVFDWGFNILYLILFIRPIWLVIKNVQGSKLDVTKKSKLTKKMVAVGMKVFILSSVLFGSSLINTFIYAASGINTFVIDTCINLTCVGYMMPYYSDKLYFYKFCRLCIFCCDRHGYTKEMLMIPPSSATGVDADANKDNDASFKSASLSSAPDNDATSADTDESGALNRSVDTNSAIRVAANATAKETSGVDSKLSDQELALAGSMAAQSNEQTQ